MNETKVVTTLRRVPAWLQALVGGLLTTLTVPPFRIWALALPGIALLFGVMLRSERRRNRFGLSLLWAVSLYGPSFWWVTAFSKPGWVLSALIESFFTAAACTALVSSRKTSSHGRIAAGVVSALMVSDSLRSLWPFGGIPLAGIDLGQANGPFASIGRWFGRLGVIGCVASVACLLVLVCSTKVRRSRVFAGTLAVGVCVLAGAPMRIQNFTRDVTWEYSRDLHTIRVIQGGGPRGLLASPENATNTFEAHLATTQANLPTKGTLNVQLVLWPENTVDSNNFASSNERKQLAALTSTYLSVGITESGGPKEFLNAQVLMNPAGEIIDRYDKVRRVPFGEFFPFRNQIEGWGLADVPNRDARPGTSPGILRAGQTTYGVLISYEGFFDDRGRNAVRAGAEVLLIPTNASSFKTSQLPSQQLAAAQLRAWETARDVVQAGPTGYSAHITIDGKIRHRTGLGTREVFDAPVFLRTGQTFYVRFNDVPALLVAAALALFALLGDRIRLLNWKGNLSGPRGQRSV